MLNETSHLIFLINERPSAPGSRQAHFWFGNGTAMGDVFLAAPRHQHRPHSRAAPTTCFNSHPPTPLRTCKFFASIGHRAFHGTLPCFGLGGISTSRMLVSQGGLGEGEDYVLRQIFDLLHPWVI